MGSTLSRVTVLQAGWVLVVNCRLVQGSSNKNHFHQSHNDATLTSIPFFRSTTAQIRPVATVGRALIFTETSIVCKYRRSAKKLRFEKGETYQRLRCPDFDFTCL